jgi:hypothetical protein
MKESKIFLEPFYIGGQYRTCIDSLRSMYGYLQMARIPPQLFDVMKNKLGTHFFEISNQNNFSTRSKLKKEIISTWGFFLPHPIASFHQP